MKKLLTIFSLVAGMALAQAPIPLTIDSRAPTAPGIDPYQASRTVYRVTFMDGTNLVPLTSLSPWMSWSSNSLATAISTASYAVVSSAGGIVDFTFTASALNPTYGPGRYIYEVGLRATAGITVYRQGILTLRGSPYAVGVPAATWTTNAVNWGSINWTGLPTTLAGYGIVDGVDLADLIAVSNQSVQVQSNLTAHIALQGTNVHGLGSSATHASSDYATAAQGTLAGTALQGEADTNALAQLTIHAGKTGTNAHGLGSASLSAASAFATSAQGVKADTALQAEADTNALAHLATHTNTPAITAHSGLGSAATNSATNFATAAQGLLAESALQVEADTNALAQLAAKVVLQANTNAGFQAFQTAQINTNAALAAAINAGGTGSVSLATYNSGIAAQANTNTALQGQITVNTTGKVSLVTYNAGIAAQANTNSGYESRIGIMETGKVALTTYNAGLIVQANTNAALLAAINAGGTGTVSLVTYNAGIVTQASTNGNLQGQITSNLVNQGVSNVNFISRFNAQANTNAAFEPRIVHGETAYGWGSPSTYIFALTNSSPYIIGMAAANAAYPASNPSNYITAGGAEPLWVAQSNNVYYKTEGVMFRYSAMTNASEQIEVLASGTNITAARVGTTITVTIPAGVKLLSMSLRWDGVNNGSTFNLNLGTNDMPNASAINRWGAVAQFYREDTGALQAGASVRLDTSNFDVLIIQGLTTASITHCRLSF